MKYLLFSLISLLAETTLAATMYRKPSHKVTHYKGHRGGYSKWHKKGWKKYYRKNRGGIGYYKPLNQYAKSQIDPNIYQMDHFSSGQHDGKFVPTSHMGKAVPAPIDNIGKAVPAPLPNAGKPLERVLDTKPAEKPAALVNTPPPTVQAQDGSSDQSDGDMPPLTELNLDDMPALEIVPGTDVPQDSPSESDGTTDTSPTGDSTPAVGPVDPPTTNTEGPQASGDDFEEPEDVEFSQ